MTSNTNPHRTKARRLQRLTGWSYCHCLHLIRTKTEVEIEALVKQAAESAPKGA